MRDKPKVQEPLWPSILMIIDAAGIVVLMVYLMILGLVM